MTFTFVSVNSDIAKYFIWVTFISVLEIVQEIIAKLSQIFLVFISIRTVID